MNERKPSNGKRSRLSVQFCCLEMDNILVIIAEQLSERALISTALNG